MMENGHCVATVHAEANAIIQAAKNGVSIDGATIYTTASPCWPCFKLIANSGCTRIVFGEFYRDPRIFEYAAKIGLELTGLGEAAQPPEPR
jgi:dCMP deaminase